jgi:hypothetical protein
MCSVSQACDCDFYSGRARFQFGLKHRDRHHHLNTSTHTPKHSPSTSLDTFASSIEHTQTAPLSQMASITANQAFVPYNTAKPVPRGFLDLPVEIREIIYGNLLFGHALRICPTKHTEDEQSLSHGQSAEAFFYLGLLMCTNTHSHHLIAPTIRYSTKQADGSPISLADVLNVMLSCTKVHAEVDHLFWSSTNFAIGISQFASFHDDVLSRKMRKSGLPRSHLVSRLQIAIPRPPSVVNTIRHKFETNLEAVTAFDNSIALSVALLSTEYPCLKSVTLTTGVILEETRRMNARPRDYLASWYEDEYPIGRAFHLQFLDVLLKRFQHGTSREVSCGEGNKIYVLEGVPKNALLNMVRRHVEHCEKRAAI